MKDLIKHCTTASPEGLIAITNTQVQKAVLVHKKSITVTCDYFPGQTSVYQVAELSVPVKITGPYEDQHNAGHTYSLYWYNWKVQNTEQNPSAEPIAEEIPAKVTFEKVGKNYVIKTPKVVTHVTYEEETVTLIQYIGLKVKEEREKRKWTLEKLSGLVGISDTNISNIERGIANPILNSVASLAEAFDMHITDLFPPKE